MMNLRVSPKKQAQSPFINERLTNKPIISYQPNFIRHGNNAITACQS